MNYNDAVTFIRTRLQPDVEPALDNEEVASLVALAAADDSAGYSPDAAEWTPTYSTVGCYRAVVEGLTIKHGKAIGKFDFTTDGQTFRRSQILDNIEAQRRLYSKKLAASVSTLGEPG